MTDETNPTVGPSSSPVANRRFEDALRKVLSVSSDRMKELIEQDKKSRVSVSADPDSDVSS